MVSSSYLFDRLVRDRWGEAARWATLWFAAGVVTLLADGQLTFALGVAFGLASLRAMQVGRATAAARAAAACALSSPVAAAFLAGVVAVGALERGRPFNRVAVWVAAIALGLVLIPNLAFPEPGQFPFSFSSYVAIPLWCGVGALRHPRPARRGAPAALGDRRLHARRDRSSGWSPNPMGGNAVRLGALFGGPVLAAVILARRPRVSPWFLALFLAGGLYWQVTASVSQIARSVGDPSTASAYFEPVSELARRARRRAGVRVEVPPTANHWEAAYLAPGFELARGWLRQLDTTRDDIFYGDDTLTHAAYSTWLRENAIRYVALPDASLDYSSVAERRLILTRPAYLDLRWRSRPLARLRGQATRSRWSSRSAAPRRTTRWVGHQGFALDVARPGDFLVRVNFTPYWSIARGDGCLLRHGDWTLVHAERPGVFRVAADFSLGRAWNAVTGARKTC